jgi:hypothetical protein
MQEREFSFFSPAGKSPCDLATVIFGVAAIGLIHAGWHNWPLYCFCFSPIVSLGRRIAIASDSILRLTHLRRFIALMIGTGFLVAWWRSGFIATAFPEYALMIQCAASVIFSLHFAAIGLSVYLC